jgi:HK97 family phage prohead protease
MLWQHDPAQPIGVWDDIREDQKGLWVCGHILTEVEKGREAAALVAAGAIDGLSIGYRTVAAEKDAKGQRLLARDRALGSVAGHLPDAARSPGWAKGQRPGRRGIA